MAADIYTKAFTGKAEWELASRLINHLRPDDFWAGRGTGRSCMLSEHKGGIIFDYWTSNPWACQAADRGLVPLGDPLGPVDASSASRQISAASSCSSPSRSTAICDAAHAFAGAGLCTTSTPSSWCASLSRVGEKVPLAVPVGSTFCRGPRKPRWRRKK